MAPLIACAQLTWKGVAEDTVLAEISSAGYDGAPAKYDRAAAETAAVFQRHGLKPAPGYYGASFWKAEEREQIVAGARRAAKVMRELGCDQLFVAASGEYIGAGGRTRRQVAGHVGAEDALTDAEFSTFAETLNAVGAATLAEGVSSCFHNHVGTVIETAAEFERLLAATDPNTVFLGPDTGHLAWGGADAAAFCTAHADRIRAVHLKDIDEDVRRRGAAEEWDYRTFVEHGIFAELGEGSVDLPTVLATVAGLDWVIVETDVTQQPTALQSATISRNHLRSLGW
ncbi:MAG TPA: sugar phosphate isomerase/epimerase [Mycobacteriales bacterium]|nr:sugar phosphate isomerase/epimerase [Mycobacteriales bacterium]